MTRKSLSYENFVNEQDIQSYGLTVLRSQSLTVLQSYDLMVLQSYSLMVLRSYDLTVLRPYRLTSAYNLTVCLRAKCLLA